MLLQARESEREEGREGQRERASALWRKRDSNILTLSRAAEQLRRQFGQVFNAVSVLQKESRLLGVCACRGRCCSVK